MAVLVGNPKDWFSRVAAHLDETVLTDFQHDKALFGYYPLVISC